MTTPADRRDLEATLVDIATGNIPDTVKAAWTRHLFLLNQDGPGPDIAAHKLGLHLGRQDADGNTRVTGWIDPEAAANWSTIESV